jgi:hypothetical protein
MRSNDRAAAPELQSIFEKLEIVTGREIKIVQLMKKSNPPVNLLPPLVYALYIKKILKSTSHVGNKRNY